MVKATQYLTLTSVFIFVKRILIDRVAKRHRRSTVYYILTQKVSKLTR